MKSWLKEQANTIITAFTSMELFSLFCVRLLCFTRVSAAKFSPCYDGPPGTQIWGHVHHPHSTCNWSERKYNITLVGVEGNIIQWLHCIHSGDLAVSTLKPIIWHAISFSEGQTKSQVPVNFISLLKQMNGNKSCNVSSNCEIKIFCKCVLRDVGPSTNY
jgi:hypothetical protein